MTITADLTTLPSFPGDRSLAGWDDRSEAALLDIRVFTRDAHTVTLIRRASLWDLIHSDGLGGVEFAMLHPEEVAPALSAL